MSLNAQEKSNLTYKGFKSVTFFLVMFGYVTETGLLILGYIDPVIWKDTAYVLLSGYVVRDGINKLTEAYYQKQILDNTPEVKNANP